MCLSACLSVYHFLNVSAHLTAFSPWTERQIEKKSDKKKRPTGGFNHGLSWERVFFFSVHLSFVGDVKRWPAHIRTLPLSLLLFFVMHDRHEDQLFVIAISMCSIFTHHTNGSLLFCRESLAIVMRSRSQQQIKCHFKETGFGWCRKYLCVCARSYTFVWI